MNLEDAERIISIQKIAHNWTGFSQRANHSGHVIGSCQVATDDGIFIPGVTITIEIKAPIITSQCLHLFTIMKMIGKEKRRIYQLEICPINKRSHNGTPVIYGPHEHIINEITTPVVSTDVCCDKWDESLLWFMNRINLHKLTIEKPC